MSECVYCGSGELTQVSSPLSDAHNVARFLCTECWEFSQVVDA